jgi:bidirectional [NiFe] hydrogenase diaphorase subunit
MPSTTTFTLDGMTVRAEPDETVLRVARRHGIDIPALCHHDAVSPYGACRLCLVEVFRGSKSRLVTSCIYTAREGEVIETRSDRIVAARRMILELLLARCPGVEVLRDLAGEYGVETSRFPETGGDSAQRCILCGLCVRVCDEVIGRHAITFSNRGVERKITTPFEDQANECIGCGACVFVCPTGALSYEDVGAKRVLKELNTAVPLVKCPVCGERFATRKQVSELRKKPGLSKEMAETCPRCRGRDFRGVMEDVLRRTGKERLYENGRNPGR